MIIKVLNLNTMQDEYVSTCNRPESDTIAEDERMARLIAFKTINPKVAPEFLEARTEIVEIHYRPTLEECRKLLGWD